MDTALPQKFNFILDRNLAKANCTENRVCTSCDTVVLGAYIKLGPCMVNVISKLCWDSLVDITLIESRNQTKA